MPGVRAPRSAPATWRTRARRSCASRWRGSSPTRGSSSTSRPGASCTSRSGPGSRAERLVFHGNNKSDAEIEAARDAGVGVVVADSFAELDRLERLGFARRGVRPGHARRRGAHPRVHRDRHRAFQVRLLGRERRRARRGAPRGRRARAAPSAGSTATSGRRCSGSTRARRPPRSSSSSRTSASARPARRSRCSTSVAASARATSRSDPALSVARVRAGAARRGRRPDGDGRARPGDRRRRRDHRLPGRHDQGDPRTCATYVAVDGGMSDNPRPVLYGAGYEAYLPDRIDAPRPLVASIAGKHCEQGDVIVTDAHLPGRRGGRRPPRHPGDRRLRVLDGQQLQQGAPPGRGLRPSRRSSPRDPARDAPMIWSGWTRRDDRSSRRCGAAPDWDTERIGVTRWLKMSCGSGCSGAGTSAPRWCA